MEVKNEKKVKFLDKSKVDAAKIKGIALFGQGLVMATLVLSAFVHTGIEP